MPASIKSTSSKETKSKRKKKRLSFWKKPTPWIATSALFLGYILFNQQYKVELSITQRAGVSDSPKKQSEAASSAEQTINLDSLQKDVLPEEGVTLPIIWEDLGKKMVDKGVIDAEKFRQLFGGSLPDDQEAMLTGSWDGQVKINQQNSRFLLDLFWALGLGNKNPILTEGEMADEKYGGAGNFASTGGWTLARGETMDHYSKYSFISLSEKQQKQVEEVSKNIYRPCCGNSTHFPDCNHGMAMLGFLELMASQGATEEQMYDTALAVNSIWFPQTYLELATYFKEQGQDWSQVDAKLVLSKEYSSGQGYTQTRAKIKSLPQAQSGGGGCGV